MAKAEQVDMSSVKIGDIIYVPLDEEDGLILKDGYKDRNKYIVIIGFTPEGVAIGALLINSEIDSSKRSEELLDCQYLLIWFGTIVIFWTMTVGWIVPIYSNFQN